MRHERGAGICARKSQDAFTKKNGVKLGFMSFFIKATVEALESGARRSMGGSKATISFKIISTTSGSRSERNAGWSCRSCGTRTRKVFADLERDIADYAKKAREGKFKIEDLQGGTFTISNGGVYGSLMSTPILNPPQSGILGMHKIMERPVAVNGKVVVRPMMYLALSYDHRTVDGKEAVTFLIKVKEVNRKPQEVTARFLTLAMTS